MKNQNVHFIEKISEIAFFPAKSTIFFFITHKLSIFATKPYELKALSA